MVDVTCDSPVGHFRFRDTERTLRVEGEGARRGDFRILNVVECPPRVVAGFAAEVAASVVASPVVCVTRVVPAADGMDLIRACLPRCDVLMRVDVLEAAPPGGVETLVEPSRVEVRAGVAAVEATTGSMGPFFISEALRRSGLRLRARPEGEELAWDGLVVRVTCGFVPNIRFMALEFVSCVCDGARLSGPPGAEALCGDANMVVRVL